MSIRKFCTILLLSITVHAIGQTDSLLQRNFSRAKDMMIIEDYSRANNYFIKTLNLGTVLPDDFAFHFGKNLYLTSYNKQSEAFLNKYISLLDSNGKYHKEAMMILNAIHEKRREAEKSTDERIGDVCEEGDHIMCPICNGTSVIKAKGDFGDVYKTCPYSNTQGLMKCKGYQEYLKGNLIPFKEQ